MGNGKMATLGHIRKRVVITGMGTVNALGNDMQVSWTKLLQSKSGGRALNDFAFSKLATRMAASIPSPDEEGGLDIETVISLKDQRKMDRFIQLALIASKEAIHHANWFPETEYQRKRTATIIASSLGGFSAIAKAAQDFKVSNQPKVSPFTIPSFLSNLAAGHIAIANGFKGMLGSPMTACAASTQAIGDSYRLISNDDADVAVCGGTEACIDPLILASFNALGAVATCNDQPWKSCRPFNQDREGFLLGEGAAILVLESLEHALDRGATPIAEIVGYGTGTDAYHITACCENGEGLEQAMQDALDMAEVDPDAIGYLNAHASATPRGDKSEIRSIRTIFGETKNLSVSSTKAATGHLLGATGAIEAMFTVLALRDSILPPTLNLDNPDPETFGIDLIPNFSKKKQIEYAMSNNTGFGGVNASLIFKRFT